MDSRGPVGIGLKPVTRPLTVPFAGGADVAPILDHPFVGGFSAGFETDGEFCRCGGSSRRAGIEDDAGVSTLTARRETCSSRPRIVVESRLTNACLPHPADIVVGTRP